MEKPSPPQESAHFSKMYETTPPWEVGHAQPAIVRLSDEKRIVGTVLDSGCGTGENALFLAARGHDVIGVDFVESAILRAREKSRVRGVGATFTVLDALKLATLGRTFDTVVDSGLFHIFNDENRARYVRALGDVTRPGAKLFLLCFSEEETREGGPRRVTQQEIRDTFRHGWRVERIEPARFDATLHPDGSRAWLAELTRTGALGG